MTEQLPDESPSVAETDAPEAQQPKAPRNNFAELQRIKDREVATAVKTAREATSEASEAKAELARASRELTALREHADFSGDDMARIKRLVDLEAQLESRAATTNQHERSITMKLLSAEHGIPTDELETYDTLADMQIAALKYQLANGNTAAGPTDDSDDASTTPPEEETPVASRFDQGSGAGGGKAIKDMDAKEWAAHLSSMQAAARQKTLRGAR